MLRRKSSPYISSPSSSLFFISIIFSLFFISIIFSLFFISKHLTFFIPHRVLSQNEKLEYTPAIILVSINNPIYAFNVWFVSTYMCCYFDTQIMSHPNRYSCICAKNFNSCFTEAPKDSFWCASTMNLDRTDLTLAVPNLFTLHLAKLS